MTPALPKWDNTAYFSSIDDPSIEAQLNKLDDELSSLSSAVTSWSKSSAQNAIEALLRQGEQLELQLDTLSTYVSLVLAVNAGDEKARGISSVVQQKFSQLTQALQPLRNHVLRMNQDEFNQWLAEANLDDYQYQLNHDRLGAPFMLSTEEEQLLTRMGVDGLHSWSTHYFQLAGTIKVEVQGKNMGLAEAANLVFSGDRQLRADAALAIKTGWQQREDTVASILSAINGWRLSEFDRRSYQQPLHYLDVSCRTSHITRDTLTALLETAYEFRSVGHRAFKACCQVNGIEDPKPYDLYAPINVGAPEYTFDQAVTLIAEAFSQFDPEMGQFAKDMCANGGVDAAPSENRATGAFCATYNATREPRVFMTYEGTMTNVLTLAHELGHAWHAKVLSELPYGQTHYPMTLAETASIFAETLVRDAMLNQAQTDQEKLAILWQEAESATTMLVNIPARFDMEKAMVEARKAGALSATQLKQLTEDAWQKWYEDSLTSYDSMFWASKLHFSISELGFYNYPYLFGYLFSLGIYAQLQGSADEGGQGKYREILKDTGSMSAEDLISKHLGQDIRQGDFWRNSINMVERRVSQLESLIS